MTVEVLTVGKWFVLIVYVDEGYEYYKRVADDVDDVFRFQFGADEKFNKPDLRRIFSGWHFAE